MKKPHSVARNAHPTRLALGGLTVSLRRLFAGLAYAFRLPGHTWELASPTLDVSATLASQSYAPRADKRAGKLLAAVGKMRHLGELVDRAVELAVAASVRTARHAGKPWAALEPLEPRQLLTTLYWDTSAAAGLQGGSGTWSTSDTCWNTDPAGGTDTLVGWTNDADAVFPDSGGGTITLASNIHANSVTFSGAGYVVSSGTLTLSGAAVVTVEQNAQIASVVTGTAGLAESGSGTLTLVGANDYSGTTTIAAGNTLQVGNGGTTGSIGTGSVADNGTLVFNRSDAVTVSNPISGTGDINQQGSGRLILTGANTYSGGTSMAGNFGTLQVGDGGTVGSLGTGDVMLSGYHVNLVFNRSDVLTVANTISDDGASLVSQRGSGTLILTGANDYSGWTTIAPGSTLQVGDGGTIGSLGSNSVLEGGGTLGGVQNDGTLAFNRSDAAGVSNPISGTGALSQQGSGTLILTGDNDYSGSTRIATGSTLQVGSNDTAGSLGTGSVTDDGALVFDRSDAVTVSNNIDGTGGLTQQGSGTLILSGVNTNSGGTTVADGSSGTVTSRDVNSVDDDVPTSNFNRVTEASSEQSQTNVLYWDGNTAPGFQRRCDYWSADSGWWTTDPNGNGPLLRWINGYNAVFPAAIGGENVVYGVSSDIIANSVTFDGPCFIESGTLTLVGSAAIIADQYAEMDCDIASTGGLSVSGSGGLVLTGANNCSGPTTIASGSTLQIGNGGTTGSLGTENVIDNGTLAFNRSDVVTVPNIISGTGNLNQQGNGSVILTGANDYSGGTGILSNFGTLQVGSGGTVGSLGTGNIVFNGYWGSLVFSHSDAVTVSSAISGGSAGLMSQQGTGTLILTGANSYSTWTTIAGGSTLQIGAGGTTGALGTGNVTNNGTLVFNRGGTVTVPGAISGSGNLSQQGGGTLVFTGTNDYSGSTTIAAGNTLQVGSNGTTGSLGTGAVTNNGTLAFKRGNALTAANTISGTGALNQLGSGTLILAGANNYSGATTIVSGTLQVGTGGTVGWYGTGGIIDNGSLVVNRSGIVTLSDLITGTGGLSQQGDGTLILAGANNYSGGTTIGFGTLQVGNGGTVGWYGTGGIIDNGTLVVNRSGAVTISDVISGTGGLTYIGAGTLTLATMNTFTGTTRIGAGMLQLGHSLALSGSTVDMNAADSGTLSFGTLTAVSLGNLQGSRNLAIPGTLTVGGTNSLATYDGVLGDGAITGSLVVAGTGTLILTGASTYSGGTTINASSTLQVGNGGTTGWYGTGGILNNGTLAVNRSGTVALSDALTGTGILRQQGSGTLILTGVNNCSSGTAIDSGTLQVGSGGTTGSLGAGPVTVDGALAFKRSDAITVSNVITGGWGGALGQQGTGTLTLSAANNYSGTTRISAGMLTLGHSLALSGSTVDLNADDAGTLNFGTLTAATFGGLQGYRNLALTNANSLAVSLTTGGGTYSGVLSGTGALCVQYGVFILTGANSYSGTTTIASGILQVGNGGTVGSLGTNTDSITNNGTLAFKRSDVVTLANAISGSGGVSEQGTGTLILATANSYTGTTRISAGMLMLGHSLALSGSMVNLYSGDAGALNFGTLVAATLGGLQGSRTLALTNGNSQAVALTTGGNNATTTFDGILSGTGSLIVQGTGTLVLTNANTYSGGTTISSATRTVQIGSGSTTGALGSGDITDNGTLTFNRSNANTVSNVIGGTGVLRQQGTGTLILTGANNYSGGTTINTGTLQVGSGGASGALGTGGITNNGALVINRTGTITIGDAITGTGSLTNQGAGTLTLAGSNTYSGTTRILGGMLTLGHSLALSGSLLDLNGTGGTLNFGTLTAATFGALQGTRNLALTNGNSQAVALTTGGNNASTTYSGVLSGAGSLVVQGTGTFILGTTNTYSGGTTIGSTRTLQVGSGFNYGSLGAGDITDNGTLTFYRNDTFILSNVISGTGTLRQQGSGVLVLTGANSYSGTTTIATGTLQVGNGGATGSLGTNTDPITNNGTLVFKCSDVVTLANTISGTGALSQQGTGTLILTGANTYSGSTTIASNSVLRVGSGGTVGLLGTGSVSDSGTLTVNRSGTVTIPGAISGTGALSQQGGGTLILTGTNNYSGSTTIAAGSTLQLGSGGTTGALGTGVVTNNGTLAFKRSDAVTAPNIISGSGSLSQQGTGTVILTAANTYSGLTTIASGTLQVGNGGTVGWYGTGGIIDNGTLAVNRSGTVTLNDVIAGSGGLTKFSTGTLTLATTNTFSGATRIQAGVLKLGYGSALGSSILQLNATDSGSVSFGALTAATIGGLQATGTLTLSNTASQAVTLTVAASSSNSSTFGGVLSGNGKLIVDGTGTLTLSGANTFSGATTINASSTLQVGSGGTTGSIGSGAITLNGTLRINTSGVATLSNQISGAGALTKVGTGTLTLSGNNSNFSGTTHISTGVLLIGHNYALSHSVLDMNATESGAVSVTNVSSPQIGGLTGSCNISIPSGVTLNDTLYSGSSIFYGTLSGAGGLQVSGTGTLTLLGANNYSGQTSISSSAVLQVGTGGTQGLVGTGLIQGSGRIVFNHTDSITIGRITVGTLEQKGTGILVLTGTSGSPTNTIIGANSTLQVGDGGTAGVFNPASVVNDGVLVVKRSGLLTVGSAISGAGSLLVQGSGTATLTGSNTYTGSTTVGTGSTLQVGNVYYSGTLGTGDLTVAGTLIINEPNLMPIGNLTGGSGSLVNYVINDAGQAGTLEVNGTVSLSGTSLVLTGNRTLSTGSTFTLIDYDGSGTLTDRFVGLPQSSLMLDNGLRYQLSYTGNDGNDVVVIDDALPWVRAIAYGSANPINADSVIFTVDFSKVVSGVDAGDFELVTPGISGAEVTNVSPGPAISYTVTVSTGSGRGLLGLNVLDDDSIIDTSGNKLGGTDTGNGYASGRTFTLLAPPTLSLVGNATASAGSPYGLTINRSDTVVGTISTVMIDWGDGNTQTLSSLTLTNALTVSHLYGNGNATGSLYAIAVTSVSDQYTTYTTSLPSESITVHNAAPLVTIAGDSVVNQGLPYTLTLSGTEDDADPIASWRIFWGDNTSLTLTGNPSNATHSYATGAINPTITATASNSEGIYAAMLAVASDPTTLTVGDPGVFSILANQSDPAASATLSLAGNSFNQFGTNYTDSIVIGLQGMVYLGSTSGNKLYPLWRDWVSSGYNSAVLYSFEQNADGTTDLRIQWTNVQPQGGGTPATFQAVLPLNTGTSSAAVSFNYLSVPGTDFAPAQVSYGQGKVGTSDQAFPQSGQAWSLGTISDLTLSAGNALVAHVNATSSTLTITSVATASSSLTTANLNVTANDSLGGTDLTYTWTVGDDAPGLVSFADNEDNAAGQTTATFSAAGTYHLFVTVTNASGASLSKSATCSFSSVLSSITATTTDAAPLANCTQQFAATAYDQFGHTLASQPSFSWNVTGSDYSINNSGVLHAGGTVGSYHVAARSGTVTSTPLYFSSSPTVALAAGSVMDNSGASAALSVLGTDAVGGSDLTYTWTVTSGNAAAVSFWDNEDNSAAQTTVDFSSAGTYTLQVAISNGTQSTTSSVGVAVAPVLTQIQVTPSSPVPGANATQSFVALAYDQFSYPLASQPTFAWEVSQPDFTINSSGVLTTSATLGSYGVIATAAGVISTPVAESQLITLTTQPSAAVDPTTHTTATLTVAATDEAGIASYTWALIGSAPGPVDFSNATNGTITATFASVGTYNLTVTITDNSGVVTTAATSVTVDQVFSSVLVTTSDPAPAALFEAQVFTATAYDQFGYPLAQQPACYGWFAVSDDYGDDYMFTTGNGSCGTLTPTMPPVNGYSVVVWGSDNIHSTPLYFCPTPSVAVAAGQTVNASGTSVALSALGTDPQGGADLTYTWAVYSGDAAAVSFWDNGDLTAANTTAYFSSTGSYTLDVTISDGTHTATSSVEVTISQVLTSILATPDQPNIVSGTQSFTATAYDQFGCVMETQPTLYWSVVGNGNAYTIDSYNGVLQTTATAGSYIVTASDSPTSGGIISEVLEFSQDMTITNTSITNLTTTEGITTAILSATVNASGTLTYIWSTTDDSPAAVTFSSNGSESTATFSAPGTYHFLVTVTDDAGDSTTALTDSVTVNPVLNSIQVTATAPLTNGTQQFLATAYDQFGTPLANQPSFSWSVQLGSNNGYDIGASTGLLTATNNSGGYCVTADASVGGYSATGALTLAPTYAIITAASATPDTAGTYADLTVLAGNPAGEDLTYTWTVVSGNPANVWFSDNGDNSAATTQAFFAAAGTYRFQVTISDAQDNTLTSTTSNITIYSVLSWIDVTTPDPVLLVGGHQKFTATAYNQFGQPLIPQPNFTWNATAYTISFGTGTASSTSTLTLHAPSTIQPYAMTASARGLDNNRNLMTDPVTGSQDALAPVIVTSLTADTMYDPYTSVILSVRVADMAGMDGGGYDLTYSWSVGDNAPGEVDFSDDGVSHPYETTATFSSAGTYTLCVTVTNDAGLSVTSHLSYVVHQTASSLQITSDKFLVPIGGNEQFTAHFYDQFGCPMTVSSGISWEIYEGDNQIDSGGAVANATAGSYNGTFSVYATYGDLNASSVLQVQGDQEGQGGAFRSNQSLMSLQEEDSSESLPTIITSENNSTFPINLRMGQAQLDPNSPLNLVTLPTHGLLTLDNLGRVTYSPNLNFFGTDSFTVQMLNLDGSTVTQTVGVRVDPTSLQIGRDTITLANKLDWWTSIDMADYFDDAANLTYSLVGCPEGTSLTLPTPGQTMATLNCESLSGRSQYDKYVVIAATNQDDMTGTLTLTVNFVGWRVNSGNNTHEYAPYTSPITLAGTRSGVTWSTVIDPSTSYTFDVGTDAPSIPVTIALTGGTLVINSSGQAVNVCVTTHNYNVPISWSDASTNSTLTISSGTNYNSEVVSTGIVDIDGYGDWSGTVTAYSIIGAVTGNEYATLHATNGDISDFKIYGSLRGTLDATNGSVSYLSVSNDVCGTVTAQGNIYMSVGGNLKGTVSSDGSVTVDAGNILQADVSAQTGLWPSVNSSWGRIIHGTLTTASGNLSVTAPGDIIGGLCTGTGTLEAHSKYGSLFGTFTASGDIPSLTAAKSLTGTITSGGNIGTLSAGQTGSTTFAGYALTGTITAGGDIGTLTATAGINATVSANGSIQTITPGDGDLAGTITAGGNLPNIDCHRDLWARLTAGANIGDVTVRDGHILGDITSTNGSIGNIFADKYIHGNITAAKNIGNIDANGGITGSLTATCGSIGSIWTGGVVGSVSAHMGRLSIACKRLSGNISGNDDIYIVSSSTVYGSVATTFGQVEIQSEGGIYTDSISAMGDVLLTSQEDIASNVTSIFGGVYEKAKGEIYSDFGPHVFTITAAITVSLNATLVQDFSSAITITNSITRYHIGGHLSGNGIPIKDSTGAVHQKIVAGGWWVAPDGQTACLTTASGDKYWFNWLPQPKLWQPASVYPKLQTQLDNELASHAEPLNTDNLDEFLARLDSASIGTLVATLNRLKQWKAAADAVGNAKDSQWNARRIVDVEDAIRVHKGLYDWDQNWLSDLTHHSPEDRTPWLQGIAGRRANALLNYIAELNQAMGLEPPPPPTTLDELAVMFPPPEKSTLEKWGGPDGYVWDILLLASAGAKSLPTLPDKQARKGPSRKLSVNGNKLVLQQDAKGTRESELKTQARAYAALVKSNKPNWSYKNDFPGGKELTYGQQQAIREEAYTMGLLPRVRVDANRNADFQGAGVVRNVDFLKPDLWHESTGWQEKWLDARLPGGVRPEGYVWHHTEMPGKMELVPYGIHHANNHVGGRAPGKWAEVF